MPPAPHFSIKPLHLQTLKNRSVIIAGAGIMQVPLIREALQCEMFVVVYDQNPKAPGVSLLHENKQSRKRGRFIQASIGDVDQACMGLDEMLREKTLRGSGDSEEFPIPEAALTVGNDHTPTVAALNERLHAHRPLTAKLISSEDAYAASHKVAMRKRFSEHGIAQPAYVGLSPLLKSESIGVASENAGDSQGTCTLSDDDEQALQELEKETGYPLIVKPAASMGSRGVVCVHNRKELLHALHESLRYTKNAKNTGNTKSIVLTSTATEKTSIEKIIIEKTIIVEKYLPGIELSVDALIHNGKVFINGVAERTIAGLPYFIELGHTFPVQSLDTEIIAECLAEFKRAIAALNIKNGAAKGDIRVCNGKVYIGEVAARLSGGYMSGWTTPLHTGTNLMHAILEITLGLAPTTHIEWPPTERPVVIERALFASPGKTLQSISGLDEARAIAGVREIFVHVAPGDVIATPKNNLMKAANVLISAPSLHEAEKSFAKVQSTISFISCA